jgi:hypothetical protein
MNKTQKILAIPALLAAVILGGAAAGYVGLANADTTSTTSTATQDAHGPRKAPGVFGTIASISGTTITVTTENRPQFNGQWGKQKDSSASSTAAPTTTTYTVDASSATFSKAGASATLSSFAAGDKIFVEGTVSGTAVTATKVSDAPAFGGMMGRGGKGGEGFMGRGVVGTVSAVNGSTITVTGKDGKSYTVDAGSATFHKTVEGSVSDITIGQTISVDGTVSGTSVIAKNVMENLPTRPAQSSAASQ